MQPVSALGKWSRQYLDEQNLGGLKVSYFDFLEYAQTVDAERNFIDYLVSVMNYSEQEAEKIAKVYY